MKISPNDPQIINNLPKIKEIIMKENITLYFLPSPYLREIVAQGTLPLVQNMPLARKAEILTGEGISIQKRLVLAWLSNKLDAKNTFILSNGDIRIIDSSLSLQGKLFGETNG